MELEEGCAAPASNSNDETQTKSSSQGSQSSKVTQETVVAASLMDSSRDGELSSTEAQLQHMMATEKVEISKEEEFFGCNPLRFVDDGR